jgi:hypothetical protein
MKLFLPRVFFLISRIITASFQMWIHPPRRSRSPEGSQPQIIIEAGERGWSSIELKELYQSASEYLGDESALRLVVDRNFSYWNQVKRVLETNPDVTHYLYDPRTGRAEDKQNLWNALTDSVSMALLLRRYGVTPVVLLTDIGYRYWRYQAAAVSAQTGVVISFMSNKLSRGMFPHKRLIGPSIFPMSQATLRYLMDLRRTLEAERKIEKKVRFTGSLYEPRTSFFKEFERLMSPVADIRGRELGSTRKTDAEYWELIASAAINITTADQFDQPGADLTHVKHMVYRYLEVLACGSLLLAPVVPGVLNYLTPGLHFVAFDTVADAHEKAVYYLNATEEADLIRREGQRRASALIESHVFWMQINAALGPDGFF